MHRVIPLFLFAYTIFAASVSARDLVFDDFKASALNETKWCSCQIDQKNTPIVFRPDRGDKNDHIIGITVAESSLGGRNCMPACKLPSSKSVTNYGLAIDVSKPEFLGMSFFGKSALVLGPSADHTDPFCDDAAWKRAKAANQEGECIQRQELRLQKPFVQKSDIPLLYSFRFRMPKEVLNTTDSIRWVTAQWKEEPINPKYEKEFAQWSPSPFLAQRYDDGILHVTIQDDMCRCIVASAPFSNGKSPVWKSGTPQYCQSIRPEESGGKACTPDLKVEYGADPILKTPAGQWVEMSYRVQASRTGKGFVEIHQGKTLIAKITGKIGYEPDPAAAPMTKFKIGQYRDYIPSSDTMDIDWIRIQTEGN